MRRALAALAVCASLALADVASAGIMEFNFNLSGDQEVPPTGSDAVGSGQLLYDDSDMTFDLDLMVFGITLAELHGVGPNSTPVHIHLAPPGVNGPIVIDLGFLDMFEVDGQGIRLQITNALLGGTMGGVTSDPAVNEAALFAGNLYVNVHTMNFEGGEIRGQIPPIPAPGAIALLGCAAMIGSRRRRR
jgi:hypothetical protein